MRTGFYPLLILSGLLSCRQSLQREKPISANDTTINNFASSYVKQSESTAKQNGEEYSESAVDTFYIVQVAEGTNYDSLLQISHESALELGSRFDMLDRVYKTNKGIIVPESSEDEIYQGEYYPRRPFDNQNFVSIEMSSAFVNDESDTLKMIVLANICKTKSQADSIVALLKKNFSNARSLRSELFMGCMH